eukprot:CAMPEP_0184496684 /NCGR_PEP_ID=MMETSP0113_2-20130426/34610_1 /TAXON_ID=91329 /ORGANISM="Norrisiella sphaerica, Strain BC52" /LENGTH=502 /DNA_ID=CAMNT_0026883423 /DNA_START=107 /DNA_END=1615 /DNA_ORIENTATION=-
MPRARKPAKAMHSKGWNSTKVSAKQYMSATEALAMETSMMEERLALLRAAMTNEKKKRAMPKTSTGTRWGAAKPVKGKYSKAVMEKINQRIEKDRARKKAERKKAKTSHPGSSYVPPLKAKKKSKGDTGSAVSSGRSSARRNSFVSDLLEGFPERIVSELFGFTEQDIQGLTREDCIEICGKVQGIRLYRRINPVSPQKAKDLADASGQAQESPMVHEGKQSTKRSLTTGSQSNTAKVVTRNAEVAGNAKAQMTSLLDGHFDEKGGHQDFLRAREEFLKGGSARAQIVYEGSGASCSTNTGSASTNTGGQSPPFEHSNKSLIDGHFDEAGGHNAFLEARKAFLAGAGVLDEKERNISGTAFTLPPSEDDGSWKPESGLGLDGMLKVLGISENQQDVTTSRLEGGSQQGGSMTESNEKASCYNCYKLFYKDKGVVGAENRLFCNQSCLELDAKARQKQKEALILMQEKLQEGPGGDKGHVEAQKVQVQGQPIIELADDSDEDE